MSADIKNKFGRKDAYLLPYKQLGIAILSPHGREGWGLVDYAWSLLEKFPKEQKDSLPLNPARFDVVCCSSGPHVNMLQSTKYNRGFKGMKIPGAGLDGLTRVPSYILTNPKFSNLSEDVNTTNQAAISSHSTTTALVLPLHQLSIGQKQSCTPGYILKVNPMSGPPECVSDSGPGTQEGVLDEQALELQPQTSDTPVPDPGSVSLFGERNFKFPQALWDLGGSGILVNHMCEGCPGYLLSANVFDLKTSVEATMLYILDNALKHQGENWPELLCGYTWFPKALSRLSPAKRLLRWEWLMRQEPGDPDSCTEAMRHPFWLAGYADNKLKDDRMIANGGFKVINYSEFREVIAKAVLEISQKSLGPIEVGKLTRRHWTPLNEPVIQDLKNGCLKKIKKPGANPQVRLQKWPNLTLQPLLQHKR